ncbi:MAG: glycosyltransferase family 4 protein [Campylobacterales bacterium]|nr:glycosyltransferase family 4 protein [Campylobacterales bacterium]
MKNKNILEFCLSSGLGGLELFVKSSYEYFGLKTNCFVCVAPDTLLDKAIESDAKFKLKRSKFFPLIPALKLAKIIDEKDIDIIHFHWNKDIITVVLAKVLSKKNPKIIYSRHMGMTRFKDDFYHRWIYKNIDTIHAVTYGVKEQLEKFIPKEVRPKLEKVYLGVDEPEVDANRVAALKEKYDLKDKFTIGIVGRIEEPKGQYLVIDAIKELKDLDIKLLIVGHTMDEGYLQELKDKVKQLCIEDKVVFTGFTKEINEHIKLCDATVLATTNETFGLVVIESMVNKVPVIATAKGGPLEIIEDGVNGVLFERDAKELAKKIEMLYADKELKNSIADGGYGKVKRVFDKDKQMQKLYELLRED